MSDHTPTADELIVGTHGYGHRTYEGGWWELACTGCSIFKGKRLSHLDGAPVDAHVKDLTDRAIAKIRADAKVEAQEAWAIESRLAPRFWKRVDVREDTACWLFDGPELESGHRRYDSPAGQVAHRYAWALANVRLPTSLEVVRHKCDNPPCVNPAHLEIGLQVDNVADMIDRGRANFTRERCRNGHERTPDNIAVRSDGEQRCLTCQRESNRRQKERTGRFECPECCSLLVKGNMRRHRKMLHGITDETHQEWLALVKGQSGTFLDRADNLEAS